MENKKKLSDIDFELDVESCYLPNSFKVDILVSKKNGIYVPDLSSNSIISFVYKNRTIQDDEEIRKRIYLLNRDLKNIEVYEEDSDLYDYLLLRRCLIAIGDKILKYKNGWMVKEDWDFVKKIQTNLIILSLSIFDYQSYFSKEESGFISKQMNSIFQKNSSGIMNPHFCVGDYINKIELWDKLGITQADKDKISYKDFIEMKKMIKIHNEKTRSK